MFLVEQQEEGNPRVEPHASPDRRVVNGCPMRSKRVQQGESQHDSIGSLPIEFYKGDKKINKRKYIYIYIYTVSTGPGPSAILIFCGSGPQRSRPHGRSAAQAVPAGPIGGGVFACANEHSIACQGLCFGCKQA